MALTMWFWALSILAGLVNYLLLLLMNREPERRAKMNHPAMLIGAVAAVIGMRSAAWAGSVAVAIPGKTEVVTIWLATCGLSGLLTVLLSGAALLLDGAHGNLPRYRNKDWCLIWLFPSVMLICLALSPVFKVPDGSLVAEHGRILPYRSSYNFRPYALTDKVALSNPAGVSVRRHANSKFYGDGDLLFSANVTLGLGPGDPVPQDFNWFAFQGALNSWFADRLDDRFVPEPVETDWKIGGRKVGKSYESARSIGSKEFGLVMGIPVAWDGAYYFGER